MPAASNATLYYCVFSGGDWLRGAVPARVTAKTVRVNAIVRALAYRQVLIRSQVEDGTIIGEHPLRGGVSLQSQAAADEVARRWLATEIERHEARLAQLERAGAAMPRAEGAS